MTTLGTLSIHLDAAPCAVGCDFCYLGARTADSTAAGTPAGPAAPSLPVMEAALATLDHDEVAVAVSEPFDRALLHLRRIIAAARRPLSVTTTPQLARRAPQLFEGVARVNLSIDSHKGVHEPDRVGALVDGLKRAHPRLEVVLLATLDTPAFAARLVDGGLLAALVDLPAVDRVALHALKPPPDWCDRAFWMRTLARLGPLLARTLDTRLFVDCYVAARLLRLGGCPARADLSPAMGGVAFRSCVYQPAPDFVAADARTLAARLQGFVAPARCPFDIK